MSPKIWIVETSQRQTLNRPPPEHFSVLFRQLQRKNYLAIAQLPGFPEEKDECRNPKTPVGSAEMAWPHYESALKLMHFTFRILT